MTPPFFYTRSLNVNLPALSKRYLPILSNADQDKNWNREHDTIYPRISSDGWMTNDLDEVYHSLPIISFLYAKYQGFLIYLSSPFVRKSKSTLGLRLYLRTRIVDFIRGIVFGRDGLYDEMLHVPRNSSLNC